MTAEQRLLWAVERVIAYNARCLGEEPSIGVHCLRDGRVYVYDLDKGWRRQPRKEYRSLRRAYEAAIQATANARRVRALIQKGRDKQDAILRVTDERRVPATWTVRAVLA